MVPPLFSRFLKVSLKVFYQLSPDTDSLFENIPFNPSHGLFLSQFIFSIIEKKIKVKINSYR
ncbi:hypothetical protein B6228_03510, partial [Candidatus Atribacteria bacterium 4572_76]